MNMTVIVFLYLNGELQQTSYSKVYDLNGGRIPIFGYRQLQLADKNGEYCDKMVAEGTYISSGPNGIEVSYNIHHEMYKSEVQKTRERLMKLGFEELK